MHQYSVEQKQKAVELYIQYEHCYIEVFFELGYPSKSCLNKWYREYLKTGETFSVKKRHASKYTDEQRAVAVEFYLTHGKSIAKTIQALGYPGKSTLCEWLNEDVPDKNRKWFYKKSGTVVRCSQEQIGQAVIDYCSGNKTPNQSKRQMASTFLVGKNQLFHQLLHLFVGSKKFLFQGFHLFLLINKHGD